MTAYFLSAYQRLSETGACDSPRGMECQRVYEEWLLAGQPDVVEAFIRERANAMPADFP